MVQAINFDFYNLNKQGGGFNEGNFGGGGSGGSFIAPNIIIATPTTPLPTTPANRLFQITTNATGAQIYINGIDTYKLTSQNLTFTKEELLVGDKVITLQKEGYATNEKYVISLENPTGATIIRKPFLNIFNLPDISSFGIATTEITVKYYINDIIQIFGQSQTLNFNLIERVVIVSPTLYNFNVNINGAGNSIKVIKNGNVEFFPDNGSTPYSDLSGTTFKIETANVSLYRITQIQVNSASPVLAKQNESLTYTSTLSKDSTISIITELVKVPIDAATPQITLLKNEVITYNINSQIGVRIGFLKNEDVKAVTVIIGSDILEFDNLQEGDVAGITIPHSVFKNIGKFGAKIFPFSLNDYEQQVRPGEPAITIASTPYNGNLSSTEVITEVMIPIPSQVVVNPYVGGGTPSIGTPKPVVVQPKPLSGGGSSPNKGVGSSRFTQNYR
jgi:hypothetical protein|tara:strand:+ start:496 stop:1833 length:1338 start_codon:yes stop_codon:yes gene_type:complete